MFNSPDITLTELHQDINTQIAKLKTLWETSPDEFFSNRSVLLSEWTAMLNHCLQHPSKESSQRLKNSVLQGLSSLLALPETNAPQNPSQVTPHGNGWVALAQINPAPGDLAGNAKKIIRYMATAEAMGVDLVIFPELTLMGYPIRDVIIRHPWLVDENMKWLHEIAKLSGKTRALVGFVEPRENTSPSAQPLRIGNPYYNSVAILGEGTLEGVVRKSLLPNYGEYEDKRTFHPSETAGIIQPKYLGKDALTASSESSYGNTPSKEPSKDPCLTLHSQRYGISICEDIWNDPQFFHIQVHDTDPIGQLMAHRPNILINLSASVSRSRKEQMKHNMLSHVARQYGVPLVYVNQVGAVDECSFDGASRAYNAQGELIARGQSFQEELILLHPSQEAGVIRSLPVGLEETLHRSPIKIFDPQDTSDLGRTYETLCQGIRDYFQKTGFQRAVLGLSGGIDSAVVATLLADALGPKQVLALTMPSALSSEESKKDANRLASQLGIHTVDIPIGTMIDPCLSALGTHTETLQKIWGPSDPHSNAQDNIQAIQRATLLRLMGNNYRALPIATSDKSEFYLGYTTVNGDMSGALAPIGDIPKTKVFALAQWLNAHHRIPGIIPDAILQKPPGAELAIDPETGISITAESVLMPYEFADEVIWRIESLHQGKSDMMKIPFYWEERHGPLSLEQKQQWLNRFFNRMSAAVFKWWLAPPTLIVEGNGSITKTDYHHPITACGIQWDRTPSETIREQLSSIWQSEFPENQDAWTGTWGPAVTR